MKVKLLSRVQLLATPGLQHTRLLRPWDFPGESTGVGCHCLLQISASVQFSSVAQSCPTLFDPMNRSMPGLPVHHQLPEFTQLMCIESVMPSNHLILCHTLFLLPPIPPSIRVFSNELTLCMSWPKTGLSALASFFPKKSQG